MTLHEIIDAVKKLPEQDLARLRDEVWPSTFVPSEQERADIQAARAEILAGKIVTEEELLATVRRRR